jgi:hypothetical protein
LLCGCCRHALHPYIAYVQIEAMFEQTQIVYHVPNFFVIHEIIGHAINVENKMNRVSFAFQGRVHVFDRKTGRVRRFGNPFLVYSLVFL